jgi:hypothetical protein
MASGRRLVPPRRIGRLRLEGAAARRDAVGHALSAGRPAAWLTAADNESECTTSTPRVAATSTMAVSEGVTPASRFARTLANQTFANPAPHGAREVLGHLSPTNQWNGFPVLVRTPLPCRAGSACLRNGTGAIRGVGDDRDH